VPEIPNIKTKSIEILKKMFEAHQISSISLQKLNFPASTIRGDFLQLFLEKTGSGGLLH
jgi:hypothetical protein